MEIIRSYKKAEALLARRAMAEAPETEKREATVQKIIDEVKRRGDAALIEYTQTFDKVELTRL
jgi:histidinol dehydrogenase